MLLADQLSFWSCQACQQVWASSPQQFTMDPRGRHPRHCWRDCDQLGRLCSLGSQGWCAEASPPKSCRCALSAQVGRRRSTSCSSELSCGSSHGLAASFLHCARDFIPSALRDWPMVTRLVVSTRSSQTMSCSSSSCSSSSPGSRYDCQCPVRGLFILHAGGLMVYLEVDYKFCVSPQVVFRCSLLRVLRSMCAAGRRSHTFSRAFHFMLFTLARVLSCSLDVLFRLPDGSSVVARAGYRTSHTTSTRCPSAEGTTFLKTFARTLMKRRVIAWPSRSRTPRRSQTHLAYGQRRHGHGSARSLLSLSGESGLTDSCEWPLC